MEHLYVIYFQHSIWISEVAWILTSKKLHVHQDASFHIKIICFDFEKIENNNNVLFWFQINPSEHFKKSRNPWNPRNSAIWNRIHWNYWFHFTCCLKTLVFWKSIITLLHFSILFLKMGLIDNCYRSLTALHLKPFWSIFIVVEFHEKY